MKNRAILLLLVLIIIFAVAGFLLANKFMPESAQPVRTIPSKPPIIKQPSGNFSCEEMRDEIEKDIETANYCLADSDCDVLGLGGIYVEFGCYHFINKEVDKEQFYAKMGAYREKCSKIIDDCAMAPEAKCVSNKCISFEENPDKIKEIPIQPKTCDLACGSYHYSTCPEGCIKSCIPSTCSGNICTSDCGGKGSCSCP